MAVEPIPCAPGGDSTPVEVNVTTCCAPSIASAALCREDGSTILLVVRSGCVECGETAQDPEVVGWIDPATGVFTPGASPADAGPCDTGCADTICVQRCDDVDGDGKADTTYNELWCVRLDGSTELVLTYQGDPSQPYGPVSPVDCEYRCVETQTYVLCDDSGGFLRRITIGAGQHIVENLELDGLTPHTIVGTVRVCGDSPDTTSCVDTICVQRCDDTDGDGKADTTYNELWCVHADGTTELILTYQGDPSQPYGPVSPVDCEYGCVETQTYMLCDASGAFLRRITIGAGQHIVEDLALDGLTPHTVTGTVGACAGDTSVTATPGHDLTVLCDTAADGTVTEFVRDYQRDAAGKITGHSDYTLDGQPYTLTGTVGVCGPTPDCPVQSVLQECRCDDTNGDGTPDVGYVELLAVDCTGTVTTIGTYTDDLGAPYTPVSPVDCDAGDDEGADPAFGVQARRAQLNPGDTWSADRFPTLQAVTATAFGGTGTITTADGVSTLHDGEVATWSVIRDSDASLTGPLTIRADTGTLSVTYTLGVQL
ncbi:hypothetical protein ABZ464_23870 [Streptomyces sp. NPDC005820]|uniref:hypothetical protein n=1 Tax=Streptomyces sp. NPDC005820 TaxID=3157069 RepID=UPI0033F75BE4